MSENVSKPNGSDRRDFSNLSAFFIGCTLKRSPEVSHTEGLMRNSMAIMEKHGVKTELIRAVDQDIAPGVQPDMTEHGHERDDWPAISKKVMAADILILGTPIWLARNRRYVPVSLSGFIQNPGRPTNLANTSIMERSAAVSSPATKTASSIVQ